MSFVVRNMASANFLMVSNVNKVSRRKSHVGRNVIEEEDSPNAANHLAQSILVSAEAASSIPLVDDENPPVSKKPKPIPTEVIKLNIGGTTFRLRTRTILSFQGQGFLPRFVRASHDTRLSLCQEYIPESNEYYFERSAQLFEPIFLYYITGECHRPALPCMDLFISELAFWGLRNAFFARCCWPQQEDSEPNGQAYASRLDMFDYVVLGRLRKKIWNLVEVPESSFFAHLFAMTSILAVAASNTGLVLGSMAQFQVNRTKVEQVGNTTRVLVLIEPHFMLDYIEAGCIAIFSLEYVLKILAAPNRKEVFLQPMNLIDLIAILPFYMELSLVLLGIDTAELQDLKGALLVVRILRVLRIVRLLKLGRYSTGLQVFAKTMRRSMVQLYMVMAVVGIGIMFFATLIYFLEKDEPDTLFFSIPATFWWCIVTMTTVGYGDMVPETTGGKLVGSCCIACGVLVLSLPITVMVENFMKVQEEFNLKPSSQSQEQDKSPGRMTTSSVSV